MAKMTVKNEAAITMKRKSEWMESERNEATSPLKIKVVMINRATAEFRGQIGGTF
jgi:hypothetical protein